MSTTGLKLTVRSFDEGLAAAHRDAGAGAVAARVLASRLVLPEYVRPSLKVLDNPSDLPDIGIAAERIAEAVESGQRIAIETDYDVDGTTAHAIIRGSLIQYLGASPDNVVSFIGHRLKEGYGLSESLAQRIIADGRVNLVITADNGTSDEPRIKMLKDAGIDTIVTDHHGIPDDLGTAVVVQAMVFGNLNQNSGSGVAFTRNPITGVHELYGEYLSVIYRAQAIRKHFCGLGAK